METTPDKKGGKPRKPKKNPQEQGPNLWIQLAIASAVFLVLSAGYSGVKQYMTTQSEEIPLSQLALDIRDGKVASIVVEGDTVKADYTDETKKTSQKEGEASFTETLNNYGLTTEQIAGVKIEVTDQGGARFWFLTLAPLLIPILLIVGIMWFL